MIEAIRFLTVIPMPGKPRPLSASASVWFPVIGAALGIAGAALNRLGQPLLVLALRALLTGALHEDGLADTFDAFGGGRSREEILRILKDSRIGTYGALALMLSVLIRWQAMISAPAGALIAAQTLPRAGMVALGWLAGPATEGLGGAWAAALRWWHPLMAAVAGAAIITITKAPRAGIAAGACLAIVLVAAWYFRRRIGGITGDCLGAVEQIQEIAVLLIASHA